MGLEIKCDECKQKIMNLSWEIESATQEIEVDLFSNYVHDKCRFIEIKVCNEDGQDCDLYFRILCWDCYRKLYLKKETEKNENEVIQGDDLGKEN